MRSALHQQGLTALPVHTRECTYVAHLNDGLNKLASARFPFRVYERCIVAIVVVTSTVRNVST